MYWIWLIYDEWLWRYEWWSEITKWRLDDVMVGWSGWKGYCIHSSLGQRYCESLKMIAHSVFEISSTQNSWDLTFDLHLHNQDGLISTWCFYVIWLSSHIPYAHEIWAIYDEWLWRYEWWSEITKWRLDDVMVGWSGWKGYCIHSSSGQRYCENLKKFWEKMEL